IRVEDSRLQRLTEDVFWDEAPSFAPDGKSVVFMSTRGGGWSWGFFRLRLMDGHADALDTPDFNERNFPRMGKQGELLYGVVNDAGVESLVERRGPGGPAPLGAETRSGRWPSYSADGSQV